MSPDGERRSREARCWPVESLHGQNADCENKMNYRAEAFREEDVADTGRNLGSRSGSSTVKKSKSYN